jgi:hypothetical protein
LVSVLAKVPGGQTGTHFPSAFLKKPSSHSTQITLQVVFP